MSRIFYNSALLCMLFIMAGGDAPAQTATTDQSRQERRERRERRAREAQRRQEALFQGKVPPGTATVVGRSVISSTNKGFGTTAALLEAAGNANIRNELGLTDEQAAGLKAARDELRFQMLMTAPKYVDRFKTMTEADHRAIQQDIEKELAGIQAKVDNLVTPEQRKKAQTLVFQGIGGLDSPIINLDAMSALDLSDEQKEKMKGTFKEMESERIAQMEEGLKLAERVVQLGGVNMSPEDRKALEAEGRTLQTRIMATGQNLGNRLRAHLTDAQKDKEKQLLANRPAFLPRLPRQMRGDFTGGYAPGLGSWMPGQGAPVPDETKSRRRPFPQKEIDEED